MARFTFHIDVLEQTGVRGLDGEPKVNSRILGTTTSANLFALNDTIALPAYPNLMQVIGRQPSLTEENSYRLTCLASDVPNPQFVKNE